MRERESTRTCVNDACAHAREHPHRSILFVCNSPANAFCANCFKKSSAAIAMVKTASVASIIGFLSRANPSSARINVLMRVACKSSAMRCSVI